MVKRRLLLFLLLVLPFWGWGQVNTLSRQYLATEVGNQVASAFLEDSYGFVWVGTRGLFRYDGYALLPYFPWQSDSSQVSVGIVHSLLEDREGRIWMGTSTGLFHYEREADQLKKDDLYTPDGPQQIGPIFSLLEDSAGRLWVGGQKKLLVREDTGADEFQAVEGIELGLMYQESVGITAMAEGRNGEVFAASNRGLWVIGSDFLPKQYSPEQYSPETFQILGAAPGNQDSLWLATTEGLWIFDMANKTFARQELPAGTGKVVHEVLAGKKDEVWIAAKDAGLLRRKDGVYTSIPLSRQKSAVLFYDYIRVLMLDRFDNLWIGARSGIKKLNLAHQRFPFYQIEPGSDQSANFTQRVMEDSQGGFWFRLLQLGLGYSPGLDGKFQVLLQPPSNSDIEEIKHFCEDADGNVWVLTLTNGLYKFERGETAFRRVELGDRMREAMALFIIADKKNDRYLWFSSRLGLCRLDRLTNQQKWYYPQEDLFWADANGLTSLAQSADGNIWCVVRRNGERRLVYFDYRREKFIAEPDMPGHPSSVVLPRISCIKSVPGDKIWLGTANGVLIVDPAQMTWVRLTRKDGFPLTSVLSMTPDLEGNLWFAGDISKICRFDGQEYRCYDGREDIESFVSNSAALGKDGRVTFGGVNGIYSFYPDEIDLEADSVRPKVVLTNFKMLNKKRYLGRAYETVREIRVPFAENIIAFEFTGLHFVHADRLQYRHKLENFEPEWVETGPDERLATYTNLSPGVYFFKAFAVNEDGFSTAEEAYLDIKLIVEPPWYRTWLAYILYLLAGAAFLFGLWRYELRRQLSHSEARQLKELNEFKSSFFTNITHEFRTPLTVILGMEEKIRQNPLRRLEENLQAIRRNGHILLRLVDQLLSLARLESGVLPLSYVQGDVMAYLHYIAQSFKSYAETRDIRLHFLGEESSLVMDYDADHLLNIVSNLLSNAVKFTPPGGDVYLTARAEEPSVFELRVRDTGIGILPDKLSCIFDRFYQVNDSGNKKSEGAGIGLALTRELVHLMQGQIEVKSTPGQGTEFIIRLPLRREATPGKEQPSNRDKVREGVMAFVGSEGAAASEGPMAELAAAPTVLIVEDNTDVTHYLLACLEADYHVETACDGQEGIAKARESVPDLIISDVMMPETDGFELCEVLKNDVATSHIPIVLLTARADVESKIAGLRRGADAYLAKPFHEEELKAHLTNLLTLRRRLQEKYSTPGYLNKPPVTPEESPAPLEDAFIERFRAVVEAHLDDYDLDVTKLCLEIGMSRTNLHKKIKDLTNQTTTEYVRFIRLHKAQELLKNTDLKISQIAYETGFRNHSYFTKSFAELFGYNPSEHRQRV